jgi:drug/metabolite transporter (DMT)-like permease
MRKALTVGMIIAGVALMVLSYMSLAAPWGNSTVANSNPRLQFAPAFFVLGVVLAFGSALVYEMLPDRDDD